MSVLAFEILANDEGKLDPPLHSVFASSLEPFAIRSPEGSVIKVVNQKKFTKSSMLSSGLTQFDEFLSVDEYIQTWRKIHCMQAFKPPDVQQKTKIPASCVVDHLLP